MAAERRVLEDDRAQERGDLTGRERRLGDRERHRGGDVAGRGHWRHRELAHPLEQLRPEVEHRAGQLAGLCRPPIEVAGPAPASSQERLQADGQTRREALDAANRQEHARDERLARGRVVADRERLAGRAEDDLLVGHETGKADGVDRRVAADPRGRGERCARGGVTLRVGVELDDLARSMSRPASSANRIMRIAPMAKLARGRAGTPRPAA